MIELKNDALEFSFPQVFPDAKLRIDLQRTLRIPDDENAYPLPPGLDTFPLRHVDDFAGRAPADWLEHGGVMLPMYQSEAMWLSFDGQHVDDRQTDYPFAIKIAAGKINAVTGDAWNNGLHRKPQDYMVVPEQPWLDGYVVEQGFIRQFVAMPLGAGYTAEEQLTRKAEHGGLQVIVYPMKREVFERRFPIQRRSVEYLRDSYADVRCRVVPCVIPDMGLAPGGRMKQEIYDDPFNFDDWDTTHSARCFVHIANSLVWRSITGQNPPATPPTAKQYTNAGLPWFDYYSDAPAVDAQPALKILKSVAALGKRKGDVPLPGNEPVSPTSLKKLRSKLKPGQVREGSF